MVTAAYRRRGGPSVGWLRLSRAERKALQATEVDKKFADLGLGIVDASIVALAERLDVRRILTIDADFSAVRMGKRWRKAFELVVPLG